MLIDTRSENKLTVYIMQHACACAWLYIKLGKVTQSILAEVFHHPAIFIHWWHIYLKSARLDNCFCASWHDVVPRWMIKPTFLHTYTYTENLALFAWLHAGKMKSPLAGFWLHSLAAVFLISAPVILGASNAGGDGLSGIKCTTSTTIQNCLTCTPGFKACSVCKPAILWHQQAPAYP